MIDKIKNHISNNRGKYGTAAGIGATVGAGQIDTPLANQIKFNMMANGQNLAQDAASYTDGKLNTNLVNNLNSVGIRQIAPEQIDAINQGYDKFKGGPYTGADARDAINMAEFKSIPYDQRITSNPDVDAARIDAFNSGMNYVKKGMGQAYGHMTEATDVISIPVKQMLLEGTTPEEITEMAVHANHPKLSKSKSGTNLGYTKQQIQANRNDLAKRIKSSRLNRDTERKFQFDKNTNRFYDKARKNANESDNYARSLSQTGNNTRETKEIYSEPNIIQKMLGMKRIYIGSGKDKELMVNKPRSISSAKQ